MTLSVSAQSKPTTTQAESGHPDARYAATGRIDTGAVEGQVNLIPDAASAYVNSRLVVAELDILEARHRNLDASRRREALIGSVAAPLDREGRLR